MTTDCWKYLENWFILAVAKNGFQEPMKSIGKWAVKTKSRLSNDRIIVDY
jgi:hypothetical protein